MPYGLMGPYTRQTPSKTEATAHVGSAPGSVDGEKSEPREREAVDVAVSVGDHLVGLRGRRLNLYVDIHMYQDMSTYIYICVCI